MSANKRKSSFTQPGSGDVDRARRHRNEKPPRTAASMSELEDDEENVFPNLPSISSFANLDNIPSYRLVHAPHCPLPKSTFSPHENLLCPTDPLIQNEEKSQTEKDTSKNDDHHGLLSESGSFYFCACALSYVRLSTVTSSDQSRECSLKLVKTSSEYAVKHKTDKRRCAKPTVLFNVGGKRFETYRSTLKRLKGSFFADDDKLSAYFRHKHGDYFFDRDPTAFNCVLNYLRTGELHVPTSMCGPALQSELVFWGIEELDIERCCWTQYNTWKTQSRSLEKLEYDRKFSTAQNLEVFRNKGIKMTCWIRFRISACRFLQDPGYSRAAKAYAWVSIIFVLVSIFSFCADTHPAFRVKYDSIGHKFGIVYRLFNLEWKSISIPIKKRNIDDVGASEDTKNNDSVSNRVVNTSLHTNSNISEQTTIHNLPHPCLVFIDLCCLCFFTLEYMTRFVCAPSRLNFLRSFQNVIDFVAISPDYVELLFLNIEAIGREEMAVMDVIFILRMLRLCRIFRLIRHVPGLWILLYTLKASFNELLLMFVFLLIGMVVFATLMHFAESRHGFSNIPIGFWWSVVTMTTVGYGDMVPQTGAGYVIGSCCAVAGLLMIAFTVPIIVSNFVLYYTHVQYGLARRDREIEREDSEQRHQKQATEVLNDEENVHTITPACNCHGLLQSYSLETPQPDNYVSKR